MFETLQDGGFATREDVRHCLARYCLQEECMDQKVSKLSGGGKEYAADRFAGGIRCTASDFR